MSDAFWSALFSNLPGIIAAIAAVLGSIWARRSMVDTQAGNKAIAEVKTAAVKTQTALSDRIETVRMQAVHFEIERNRSSQPGALGPQATDYGRLP